MTDSRFVQFFQSEAFGVIGAAKNREKYGNKVLRCYMQHDKIVYPVNPRAEEIEGLPCIKTVADLPGMVKYFGDNATSCNAAGDPGGYKPGNSEYMDAAWG